MTLLNFPAIDVSQVKPSPIVTRRWKRDIAEIDYIAAQRAKGEQSGTLRYLMIVNGHRHAEASVPFKAGDRSIRLPVPDEFVNGPKRKFIELHFRKPGLLPVDEQG